ncbi:hypothetical protein KJ870_10260 [bacterium]|jgi:purine-cytosine permease-like protein|nr:hypothetical protein [bacterium]MBU1435309.1 hypothetical protein [bacterium]MBU1503507.1 hypothetical protein [bacterium]
MQGIGVVIGVLIFIILALMPIITIFGAKYTTLFEKLIWFGIYMLGNYILLINSTQADFLFWAIFIFIAFKIFYARRKAIWLEKN